MYLRCLRLWGIHVATALATIITFALIITPAATITIATPALAITSAPTVTVDAISTFTTIATIS